MDIRKIIEAHDWYCPDIAQEVNLRGTQAVCAAEHGCAHRPPVECPLYLHFLIKTTAWYLRLSP
jgi:hypothetical protein